MKRLFLMSVIGNVSRKMTNTVACEDNRLFYDSVHGTSLDLGNIFDYVSLGFNKL